MNFFQSIWHRITRQKLIDTQYNEINRLQDLLNEEIDNYNFMKEQYELMQKTKNQILDEKDRLQFQYDLLKNDLAEEVRPDLPIDFTKVPYTGRNANTFYNDATGKLETNYTYITISKYFRFWNDEYYSQVLRLYNQKKPKTIRDKVIFAKDINHEEFMFKYQHDKTHSGVFHEHWKTIPQIWADKRLDCVADYEEIWTIEGLKKIKDLKVGDMVLSYNFDSKKYCYKPITKVWDKGKLQINRVHFRNGTHIDVSEDHPMLVSKHQKYTQFEKRPLSEIDLERWWKKKVPFAKKLPYIEKDVDWLTKDLCFVVGHFFAEGWVQKQHKNSKQVFTSGYDCPEYIAPILEKHNIPFVERINNHGVPYIYFKSSPFKDFLQTLKINSFEFTIPTWLCQLPKDKLDAILEGHFLGDGHYRHKPFECRQYSTSSNSLKEFLYEISLKLGKPLYCYYQARHQGLGKKPIWRLDDNKNSVFRRPIGYKGLGGLSISYIEKLDKTQMYDFEVKDTHNFIFKNGVITHNCEDFSILTVTTCNIIGVPADRVFMLTGFIGNEGHAFVGFIDDDGETYVLEATSANSRPIKFKGSRYKCKAPLSGISNWAWAGVPTVEQW